MELSQAEIIQKPKTQELSSLFMTHRLNVMYAPVKFHEYIPYGLGVMPGHEVGRTDGQTDARMGTYVAMHFVAKIIKWLLILSAYYCPSLCVYKLHLATLGMDYLSIAIILLCG